MIRYVFFLINNRTYLTLLFLLLILISISINLFSKSSFLTGIGDIQGSQSLYVKESINQNFKEQIPSDLIILSNDINNDLLIKTLKKHDSIKEIYNKENNYFLSSILNEKYNIYIIKLKNNSFKSYEDFTPIIRNKIKENFPNSKIYVTGNAAFSYDMNSISEKQGKEAEIKVLIITLIVLFLAFGSITGAFIAVSSGFITTIITIALLKLISIFYPLSIFSQNISTMLGLGLSIDYSLLIISRLRKEIKNNDFEISLINTIKYGGKSVIFSGITVMIGFTALFIPHLNLSDSIAIGGSIVSLIAIIVSLTYVPIMLYITKNYLNYPFKNKEKSYISENFGLFITKNSLSFVLISLVLLILLMFPVLRMKLSEPDIKTMPDNMESKIGFLELEKVSKANLFYPIQIILESDNNINDIDVYNFSKQLQKYPFTNIYSIFGDLKSIDYTNYYILRNSGLNNNLFNTLDSYFFSVDKKQVLLTIFPDKNIQYYEINNIIKDLKTLKDNHLKVYIGGQSALGYDLIYNLYKNFYLMIILIYLLTAIVLYISYKSVLIPIKAIFVNTFSVLACYGILVLVFQDGYLSWLWNLKYIPNSIISGIPVILFCIMFSLSMDYEVFLLSSMHEEYKKTQDNNKAVIYGLINTSGIITKAAMVMLIVFIAFIQADIILIKMLGVGLTFAVLIDSTIIRLILVPSLMNLAGKYNWLSIEEILSLVREKINNKG